MILRVLSECMHLQAGSSTIGTTPSPFASKEGHRERERGDARPEWLPAQPGLLKGTRARHSLAALLVFFGLGAISSDHGLRHSLTMPRSCDQMRSSELPNRCYPIRDQAPESHFPARRLLSMQARQTIRVR
jgi:hypothetical protein